MAEAKVWIRSFLKRHKARFNPHDWPDGSDSEDVREFTLLWVSAFDSAQVTEGEADAASMLLGPTPPNFRRQHLEAVMGKVWSQRALESPVSGSSARDEAKEASSACCYCGGTGLAVAWAATHSYSDRSPETAAAHCICKHGRWQKQAYALRNGGAILDFQEVLDGRFPGWLEHPPGHPELAVGSQLERPGRLRWREFTRLFQMST